MAGMNEKRAQLWMLKLMVVLLFAALVAGSGCRPAGAPAPTPVQQAAIALDDFAASVQAAQTAEISFYQQHLIDAATHVAIQKAFLQVATDTAAVSQGITDDNSQVTLANKIAAVSVDLNTALNGGVLGVKDPQTQQKLISLVNALSPLLQAVATAY